ncbi:MAG: B12-binding domain-containing radical SAM protein [Candidatus Magnetoovum sp. WYHC-5]|nr:B12-binding domain-containing radical SAM protein [Candidatus Magnetoovum sp. WYHC-5]
MQIKKISFIETRSTDAYIFRKFPIPRVGAVLLSTILRNNGYEVKAFIEDVAPLDWDYLENSDLVCISTITSTVNKAYETAKRVKRLGIPIVMGGAHPTFVPEEALGQCDYVVRGEGEQTLLELIHYIEKGSPDISTIKGLSYKGKDGSCIHNSVRPNLEDLDELPTPDFALVHKWRSSFIHPVSTTRGCAYNCSFCLVSPMFGRHYRYRSVSKVMEELRDITSKSRSPIFIVDDNFAANRKRAKELIRAMIAEGITPKWSAMVRTNIAKDKELLELLSQTGDFTASIGFESINPQALKFYEKRQDLEDNIHCIKALKEHGVKIHGMFVFGADTDTVDTIKKTTDFARDMQLDSIQFMVLTPLPGTTLFNEMNKAGRLLHTDWTKYDIHHVVFNPTHIKPEELHTETLKAMKNFYSWGYIFGKLISFKLFYAAFGVYNRNSLNRALREARDYLYGLFYEQKKS